MNTPEEVDMPEDVDAEVTWTFEEEVSTEAVEAAPVEESEEEALDLGHVVHMALNGELGRGQEFRKNVSELGFDHRVVTAEVNKTLNNR